MLPVRRLSCVAGLSALLLASADAYAQPDAQPIWLRATRPTRALRGPRASGVTIGG